MIELFYSSSPNVYKVMIALEEMQLDYCVTFVDLGKGQQFDPERIGGSLAAKVPVILDHAPAWGGAAFSVMESGAILQYLAEKSSLFLSRSPEKRSETMQWLFWQMGNLGPIGGQFWHFHAFAERIEPQTNFAYPRRRYARMLAALWSVMEKRLAQTSYLASDYSIADMACYPWVRYLLSTENEVSFPRLAAWRDAITARPAAVRAYEKNAQIQTGYDRNERGGVAYSFDALRQHTIIA